MIFFVSCKIKWLLLWILKSNERPARVRFEITSIIADQNWKTRSSIPFLKRTIPLNTRSNNILLIQFVKKGETVSFRHKRFKIIHAMAFFTFLSLEF